jgi:hypothetical protein
MKHGGPSWVVALDPDNVARLDGLGSKAVEEIVINDKIPRPVELPVDRVSATYTPKA